MESWVGPGNEGITQYCLYITINFMYTRFMTQGLNWKAVPNVSFNPLVIHEQWEVQGMGLGITINFMYTAVLP